MLYAIIAAVIAVFDQLFKNWIVNNIELFGQREFIPGVVRLTYVKNTGAAFSLLNNATWLLTAITVVFIILLIAYLLRGKLDKVCRICVALVLGGAVGNAADRLRLGYVVDMFEVEFTNYAIFNVADCFIVVGVILFCIFYIRYTGAYEKEKKDSLPKAGESDDKDS